MRCYDVAVVGGGPAGASAARAAARLGARTVLIERARLPRYKTCGGGIVGLSADLAEIELPANEAITALTLTCQGRAEVTRRARRPLLTLTMRTDLDAALVAAAATAGAEVRTQTVVSSLAEEDDAVELRVRGAEPIRARTVVGADGSASRLASYVGVRCEQVDLGLEAEFPASPALRERWAGRVLLDWAGVPGSYGWLFPKGELLSVGVIGSRTRADALRGYFRALVDRLGLAGIRPVVDTGHLTRVRAPGSPLRRGRVLVAGDAAGLLEPWTREGISFALRSGRLAGECAAAGEPAAYPQRVADVLGPEMAAGRRLLAAYTAAPALFHALLAGPGFGLFGRLVDGRTTFGRQLERPGVGWLIDRLGAAELSFGAAS